MDHNPDIQRRRSIRLKGYAYSQAGAYFVSIVTQGRECCFGDVIGKDMRLNDAGRMAHRVWESLPLRFPGVETDYFVVMPNHLHGIVIMNNLPRNPGGGAAVKDRAAAGDRATTRVAPTLGRVVGAYKSLTTLEYTRGVKTCNWPTFEGRLWQRNYYEHIVRDDESLSRIRQYISDNPAQWMFDKENPAAEMPRDVIP